MKRQWLMLILLHLIFGKQISCWSKTPNGTTKVVKRRHSIFVERNKAHQFLKPSLVPNSGCDMKEECCHEGCDYEERREYAEEVGWTRVKKELCELSIMEGRSCNCITNHHSYECAADIAGTYYCPKPCKRSTHSFYCGTGRHCVSENYLCNSDDDCGNWDDEKGCRITKKHTKEDIVSNTKLVGSGSKYWGNVYVLGRPVCDDYWNANDAKVLCRTLGFDPSHTKPFAWQNSKFGNVGTAFRMDDVKCDGDESYIGECDHVTSNNCGTGEGAGVTCIDASTLLLVGGENKFEGNVNVVGGPVCYEGWNQNTSQVVCNQKFKEKFTERRSKVVPVFSTEFRNSSNPTAITQVVCDGTEKNLARCSLRVDENCKSEQIAYVRCAKCTPPHLLEILKSIKPDSSTKKILKSVRDALDRLSLDCWNWDCTYRESDGGYPEYCQIKTFLERTKLYLETPDQDKLIKLQTKFDYGDLLNHVFMKKTFAELQDHIFAIGDKINKFQRDLGGYFSDLADFDREKAERDLEKWRNVWNGKKKDIAQLSGTLKRQLTDVYGFAFGVASAELIEDAVELAIYIANAVNPIKWLVGGATPVLDIKKAVKKLTKAGAAMARLGFAVDKGMDEMKKIRNRISKKEKFLTARFSILIKALNKKFQFTSEDAVDFLNSYKDFTPSTTLSDIVEYHTVVSELVTTACNVIKNSNTVSGAMIEAIAAATGACPLVLPTVEVLVAYYKTTVKAQVNMVASMAQIARTRIAQEKAKSLSEALGSNLEEKIRRKVTMLDSLFLLQHRKETLVREACDFITYKNHGEVEKACERLLENPSLDAAELISYDYKRDMCDCSNCMGFERVLPIPAAVNFGERSFPSGTIDLSNIYKTSPNRTKGWSHFQIPDKKWLLDNRWITDHVFQEKGPLFLQSMQFYLPPGSASDNQYSVDTKVSLMGNTLNGQDYQLGDKIVMSTEYFENSETDECLHPFKNQYNLAHCPNHFPKLCVTGSRVYNGPIYPALVGSTWKLSLDSPAVLTKPSPLGPFFIKTKVKFCYKSSSDKKVNVSSLDTNVLASCCYNRSMRFDQLIALRDDGRDPCQPCAERAVPRMYGFYCEYCQAGYEASKHGSYGCAPCKKGEFKAKAGRGNCKRCPDGLTTASVGQNKCIKVIN